jgi:hypothetical protein
MGEGAMNIGRKSGVDEYRVNDLMVEERLWNHRQLLNKRGGRTKPEDVAQQWQQCFFCFFFFRDELKLRQKVNLAWATNHLWLLTGGHCQAEAVQTQLQ